MSALIEPSALLQNLNSVKILDATFGVPDARQRFAAAHIGDAQFFDIDDVADHTAPYPHTLPSADDFARAVSALGIRNNDTVVVYDQNGISFAAARVWWMFRVMGHENICVLNGGLPAWLGAGNPTQSGVAAPVTVPTTFTAEFKPALYRSFEQMDEGGAYVIDARSAPRFAATMHTQDGDAVHAHIPDSQNMPYDMLLDHDGRMKPADAIAPLLLPLITPGAPLVATCGSGVTACVLALGFYEVGITDMAIYDGSWTEWSHRQCLRP